MNTKRLVALILAVVLILSLVAGVLPTVFSAESYTISLQGSGKNNKVTAKGGDVVEAYLYISGNPGILSAGVQLECPKDITIGSVQSALSGHDFTPTWQYSKDYSVNPYLIWMLVPNGTKTKGLVTYNGNWCKVTFRLAADIDAGDHTIRVTAPKDKNLTATTSGGVIKPETSTYVKNVAVSNLTISVKGTTCEHSWGQWKTTTAATCVKEGKQTRTCSLCQKTEEQTLDPVGHAMSGWTQTVKPTCTKEGTEKRTCKNGCGHSETRAVTKLEHKFSEFAVEKAATCEQEGVKSSVCSLCKEKITQKIEKLTHKFSAPKVTKEPTCTAEGQRTGKCEHCGKNTKEAIAALGHDFGEMKVIRQSTATEPGLKQSKCSRCDAVKEEEIPCIVEETTAATTGVITLPEITTDAETQPSGTTEVEIQPSGTAPEQTQPTEHIPAETQPVSEQPEEAMLKTLIMIAGALLLGVITLVAVIAIRSKKR